MEVFFGCMPIAATFWGSHVKYDSIAKKVIIYHRKNQNINLRPYYL